jgi:hypothetical protein
MTHDGLENLKNGLRGLADTSAISLLCRNETRRVFKLPVCSSTENELVRKQCRDLFPETGLWPVASWEHAFQHLAIYGMPSEAESRGVLQRGESFDLEEWLLREQNFRKEWLGKEEYEADLADRHGDWPMENKSWYRRFPYCVDPPEADPCMLLVEAEKFWHVPAVLGMQWMGRPDRNAEPEIHVGMLKYLHDSYGAELRMLNTDLITVGVTRPPSTRDEAMNLAYRANLYAPDMIDQMVDSFEKLAVTLMSTPEWFFWWD